MRRFATVAVYFILCAIRLTAQDSAKVAHADSITVTAERRPASTSSTSAVVRVVDAAEWQARSATDLPTVLRDIPGLQLDPVVGSGTGISIEGLGSDRVQVLLDGAPLEGRLNNQFDLTRIDPGELSRVEIVDGPQSTLYGSSALGGVINLISRAPDGQHLDFSTQGGAYGQFDQSARLSGLSGATGFSVDLGHRRIDVAPGTADGTPGSAERWEGMGRLMTPLAGGNLDVRVMETDENQRYQESFGPGAVFNNRNHNVQSDALAVLGFGGGATELRAHASVYDHTLDETANDSTSSDPQVQRLVDLEAVRRTSFGGAAWVLGARVEHEWITSDRLIDTVEDNTLGAAYGSAEWRANAPLSFSAGARLTVSQRWGTDIAPRLGLVWRPSGAVYAKLGMAHGFRAPSFIEQFSDFLNAEAFYTVQGNTALKPETSWNATGEVGLSGRRGGAYLRGFDNELHDFIEANYTGMSGDLAQFTYQNVQRARTAGAEIGGHVTSGIASVEASYAYLDTRDDSTGAPLVGRAKQTGRVAATLARHGWAVTGEVIAMSSFPLSQDPGTGAIITEGASTRANVRASTSLYGAWRVNAGADNIGNNIPANALGGFGRRWFAGLAWEGRW